MNEEKLMLRAADNIRILAASMVEKAKSGHPGGAMGGADFINVLFAEYLVYDPDNPRWKARDRFFLDPGHMSPMLYSVLALSGKFSLAELQEFRQWGSPTPGHPEVNVDRGIENTSGPLGQGHTYAVGAAMAAKFLKARLGDTMSQTIYAYISDGGIQEEISQGAGRLAGHLGLDNLIMFYDSNDIQLSTGTEAVTSEDVGMKYRAWGWEVIEIDGNDVNAIRKALDAAKAVADKPTLIIGHTIMGKGARKADNSNYENCCATHGAPLGGDAYINTIKNLGGDPADPFVIFPEVAAIYEARKQELRGIVADRKAKEKEWAEANPVLAEKKRKWFSGAAPEVDWNAVVQKSGSATRAASATVLSVLAEQVENMVVSSADLSNSDKTDGFLKKTHAFSKGDFSGAFLQAGVSELTMACCCIGMALHGGVIPACGTFFVFSDYMKPAVRMAALMETPVKFIWTHDAFRVGEDGPTHQPIEQLASLRLIPNLNVFRPCNMEEVAFSWNKAVLDKDSPTCIVLSRQKIEQIRTPHGADISKGAYVIKPATSVCRVTLIATGSEVPLAISVAEKLGGKVQVVSMPSVADFRRQYDKYKKSILQGFVVAIEAGASASWFEFADAVIGIDSFGTSGGGEEVYKYFGFDADKIARDIAKKVKNV